MSFTFDMTSAETLARTLAQRLQEKDVSLTLEQTREVIAALRGDRSWNDFASTFTQSALDAKVPAHPSRKARGTVSNPDLTTLSILIYVEAYNVNEQDSATSWAKIHLTRNLLDLLLRLRSQVIEQNLFNKSTIEAPLLWSLARENAPSYSSVWSSAEAFWYSTTFNSVGDVRTIQLPFVWLMTAVNAWSNFGLGRNGSTACVTLYLGSGQVGDETFRDRLVREGEVR